MLPILEWYCPYLSTYLSTCISLAHIYGEEFTPFDIGKVWVAKGICVFYSV